MAEKIAKSATTEEEVATAVEGVTLQQLIESYGDSRANEASNTARAKAVEEYESRYGLKNGAKKQTEGDTTSAAASTKKVAGESDDDTPTWARKLMERMDKIESTRITESRSKQFNATIEALPQTLRNAYRRTPIDTLSNEEFDKLLSDVKGEVESVGKEYSAKGVVFGRPQSSQGSATKAELTKEQLENIKHSGASEGGQPF
jgi:hypothetical protein